MALHPDFTHLPHAILDPAVRWLPTDETLRTTTMSKLMPPLSGSAAFSGIDILHLKRQRKHEY